MSPYLESCVRKIAKSIRSVHLSVGYAASLAFLFVACGSSRPARPSADEQIRHVTDSFVSLSVREPALPGFKVSNEIATSAFAGRSRSDADLLVGRMYYDATSRITTQIASRWPRTGTPTDADVHAELLQPASGAHRSRDYFDRLTRETADRAARDPKFKRAIEGATTAALRPWNQAWDDYECLLDGEPWPMTFCRSAWIFNWTS